MTYRIRRVSWYEPKRPDGPAHKRNYKLKRIDTWRITQDGRYVDACLTEAGAKRTVARLVAHDRANNAGDLLPLEDTTRPARRAAAQDVLRRVV